LYSFFKLLILLISNFGYINCIKINEKYPSTFVLSNGNIFIVTENGFRIYDSTLKIRKSYYNFPNSQKITSSSEAESVCISQYSDGALIVLVKNNIYIIISSHIYTISLSIMNGRSYNLIADKYDASSHYYIISYYENGKIHILYYHFFFETIFLSQRSSNELLKSISYSEEEKQEFFDRHKRKRPKVYKFARGETIRVYLGIDSGSTTTKFVLLDEDNQILDYF
jgi:hypothetical protein